MWLLRISLVSLVAAVMSFVGLVLLPDVSLPPGGYAAMAAVSVALWLCLSPLVYRQSFGMAVSVGLMSPLIVIAIGSPIAVFTLFFDIRYWLVFPTGALTGVLIWACLSIGQERGRGKPKHSANIEHDDVHLAGVSRWDGTS
jgi:hypothetical protein